jgi:hypothetical protein
MVGKTPSHMNLQGDTLKPHEPLGGHTQAVSRPQPFLLDKRVTCWVGGWGVAHIGSEWSVPFVCWPCTPSEWSPMVALRKTPTLQIQSGKIVSILTKSFKDYRGVLEFLEPMKGQLTCLAMPQQCHLTALLTNNLIRLTSHRRGSEEGREPRTQSNQVRRDPNFRNLALTQMTLWKLRIGQ